MQLAELTGPNRSGKSAIYSEMLKIGGFVANPQPTLEQAVKVIEAAMPHWPELRDFTSLLEYIFRTARGPDLAVKESATFRQLSKLVAAKMHPNDPRWMVVDGGLIHHGQGIDRLEPRMPLRRYFECMPVPDTVFMVTADPHVVVQRNRNSDSDKSEETDRSFHVHHLAREILKKRGVRVVDIDTTVTMPEENARTLLSHFVPGRQFTGQTAATYDRRREDQAKWKLEQKIIEEMLDEVPSGSWVLDIPCGTGRFFDYYRRRGFVVRALDASEDMLDRAREKATDTGIFELGRGDATDLWLHDKSVTASVMCRLTRWLSPQECVAALRELQRVTTDRIIFTARVRNTPHARTYELIKSALDGWKISRDVAGVDLDYRVVELQPI